MSILIEAPPPPAPQPKPVLPEAPKRAFHGAPQMDGATLVAPRQIPRDIAMYKGPEAPAPITYMAMDSGPDSATGIREAFRPDNVAAAKPTGPVHLTSTVSEGMLLQKTMPVYPIIAKATRTEGVVFLQATISRNGTIENLRVISGHPMLQKAAIDAVSNWRYRPYLLNGVPVEVETTVNVVFRLTQ
jgi:protein TonB